VRYCYYLIGIVRVTAYVFGTLLRVSIYCQEIALLLDLSAAYPMRLSFARTFFDSNCDTGSLNGDAVQWVLPPRPASSFDLASHNVWLVLLCPFRPCRKGYSALGGRGVLPAGSDKPDNWMRLSALVIGAQVQAQFA